MIPKYPTKEIKQYMERLTILEPPKLDRLTLPRLRKGNRKDNKGTP